MSEQHFAIQLEDYSLPAILPFPKTYYGTLPQIGALMDCLAADPDTAIRFASTIRAFNDYKAGHLGAVHEVCGRTFRLLSPVNLIHETVILDQDVEWDFENGAYHHRVVRILWICIRFFCRMAICICVLYDRAMKI